VYRVFIIPSHLPPNTSVRGLEIMLRSRETRK
jgi:hypothetical protein